MLCARVQPWLGVQIGWSDAQPGAESNARTRRGIPLTNRARGMVNLVGRGVLMKTGGGQWSAFEGFFEGLFEPT